MIFKRLASHLKQNKQTSHVPDAPDTLSRDFASLVRSLESVLGKDLAENIIMDFHHGESSIAVNNLVNNIVEVEPPLTEEQQERIAWFAETEDQWNERRWQEHNAEMTAAQVKKHDVKDFRTHLLAEFREIYPEKKARSQ